MAGSFLNLEIPPRPLWHCGESQLMYDLFSLFFSLLSAHRIGVSSSVFSRFSPSIYLLSSTQRAGSFPQYRFLACLGGVFSHFSLLTMEILISYWAVLAFWETSKFFLYLVLMKLSSMLILPYAFLPIPLFL